MKAIVIKSIYVRDTETYDLQDLGKHFTIVGYTQDLTELRNKGVLCHRAELDNQPKLAGFLGPMWDGGMLRYETKSVYDALSI